MNQILDMRKYWDSYKDGNPDESLLDGIKESLFNHKIPLNTFLTFVFSIAYDGGYTEDSIKDAMFMYSSFGLDEFEDCGVPAEVISEFISTASNFNLEDDRYALLNASSIWNIFSAVDDENPLKKAILNYTFYNIAFFGFYNDVEIVKTYSQYVSEHHSTFDIPYAIFRLIR